MSCLTDEVVAAWCDGALDEPERAVAIEHASGCASCRELVGAMAAHMFDGERLPVTIGRYEIIGTIGGGGMGVVLRGRDPVLDRAVAIKLARVGVDDQAQMLREAQALARLSHPNVVAVHDCGESGGEVFVAMALVEGVPLSRWLAEPHGVVERMRVLDGVAAGLAAIHDAGLVHRDIKPDNVVVRPTGEAAIVDFGLARPSARGAVGTGVAGTHEYLAPEVLAGGAATPASDQYAWWILVGEVLAGLPPRRHARMAAVRARGISRTDRFVDMREAARALQRSSAPRWRVPVAIGAIVVVAGVIGYVATRPSDDPCAWTPTAWSDQRAAIASGLGPAGVDVARVVAAIDRRAATTAKVRRDACTLARRDGADDRAFGQYRIACIDRTWAEATGFFRALASRERAEVWSALDQLGLVIDPATCERATRAIVAPSAVDPNGEVTRLGRELVRISRDPTLDTATRLAQLDALESAVVATKYAVLAARWHVLRASELAELGKLDEASAALDRGELAAESTGDDDLRTEIAIDRLVHAYMTGARDTAALEARAVALVAKIDNPVRRAQLADTRGMLLTAREDLPGAIASMREAVALYEALDLDASEQRTRALQNLAAAVQLSGDLAAAQVLFDQGLAVSRRRFGETSAETYEMRGARATNLMAAGKIDEARRELEQVVDGLAKLGGPGDRALGMAQMMLCQAETEAKSSSAVERCRAALASAETAYGKEHPQVVAFLTIYGNALRSNGRAPEAVAVLTRAIAIGETGTIDPAELALARGYFALALHAVDANDPRARASARAAAAALADRPDAAALVAELGTTFP